MDNMVNVTIFVSLFGGLCWDEKMQMFADGGRYCGLAFRDNV